MERPAGGEGNPRRSEKLPRSAILRRRAVLQNIRTRGRRRSNRWIVLTVEVCPEKEKAQAAFLTPKRIGAANVRNRLRRRMREIHRRYVAPGEAKRLWLWSARPEAAQISFQDLKEAMLQLCSEQKSNRRSP